MDDAFRVPGTRWRIGLDPLLGLAPGVGDWLGWAASVHVLVAAARLGAPATLILRMAANALVDALVGVVPLLGDLFDAGWKANRRNLALLERHVADADRVRRGSRALVAAVLLGSVAVLGAAGAAAFALFRWALGSL